MNILQRQFIGKKLGLILFLSLAQTAWASDFTRVNRYSLHTLAAEPSQVDLLSAVIDTRFPARVETVGMALDYLLYRSGYRHIATQDILHTLELPLPEAHRNIGPLDVRSAVETIVGQPWQLQENSRRRVLWFQWAGADPLTLPQSVPLNLENGHQTQQPPSAMSDDSPSKNLVEWKLKESRTLRENLQDWVHLAEWSLEWRSQHDYAITHSAIFSGTLIDATQFLLKHYRHAPIPLVAKFYKGNRVLVIEPDARTSQ